MLKIADENMICESNYESDLNSISLVVGDIEFTILYDGSKNAEEQLEQLTKEKERLESSIARREKLLSNENYVSKAPANIVDQERKNLEKEKNELALIMQKLI